MKDYLDLIRAKHWLKNILIFLPVFFSTNILNKNYLVTLLIAFIIFCFSSSIVYILNDINDIEKDKMHPIKKNRPLAKGAISKNKAIIIMIFLILITCVVSFILYNNNHNIITFIIPLFYIMLNILYSKGLKNIPIIDVVIIVFGFVLRVMYGGIVVGVEVSKYLYLMIIFGAFFLGFGKLKRMVIKVEKY